MNPDHEINLDSWNELAAVHGQDAYYDSEAVVAGASSLIEEEEAALAAALGGKLDGCRVLHMQCHLGFDAITLAQRGARVTGVDFSSAALAKARLLADRCGVGIEWVCADATELPPSLGHRFDLVWATMGILCWIADVGAWMRGVTGTLVPAGRLVLIDGYQAERDDESVQAGLDGVHRPLARRFIDSGWDYATSARTGPQVQFRYSLRTVVKAATDAGLHVSTLHEYTGISSSLRIPHLAREDDGLFRRRVAGQPQPILFTMIADR